MLNGILDYIVRTTLKKEDALKMHLIQTSGFHELNARKALKKIIKDRLVAYCSTVRKLMEFI